MDKTAELKLDGKSYKLPIVEGTEKELAVDISSLRNQTGYITLDDGYGNTGSCHSKITFIDGEQGILRYRGIPIEELAEKSTFIEMAHLIIYGHLPSSAELRRFLGSADGQSSILHEDMKYHFEGFPLEFASDGDPLGDDQRHELLLSRADERSRCGTVRSCRPRG